MNINKLQRINNSIQRKQTGNPTDFAKQVEMSKSMLHRYINFMKSDMKAPIRYNRHKQSYEYTENGILGVNGWCEE